MTGPKYSQPRLSGVDTGKREKVPKTAMIVTLAVNIQTHFPPLALDATIGFPHMTPSQPGPHFRDHPEHGLRPRIEKIKKLLGDASPTITELGISA